MQSTTGHCTLHAPHPGNLYRFLFGPHLSHLPKTTSHSCLESSPLHAWNVIDMAFVPTVLFPLTLSALLDHVLSSHTTPSTPTTLLICSDRSAFLQDLSHSLKQHQGADRVNNYEQLLAPSLLNLSRARHVKLAFCASVQALLAYLTAYHRPGYVHAEASEGEEKLVIVNLLALHKPTSAFSAQGLSRAFAAATDTALRTGVELHLVECEATQQLHDVVDLKEDTAMHDDGEDHHHTAPEQVQDPWDQHVPILNISVRRFGSAAGAGHRSWAGRTVKAKRIAARWFHFHDLAGPDEEPE